MDILLIICIATLLWSAYQIWGGGNKGDTRHFMPLLVVMFVSIIRLFFLNQPLFG